MKVWKSRKPMTEVKLSTKEKPSVVALRLTDEEPSTPVADAAEPANMSLSNSLPTKGHHNFPESHTDEGTSKTGGAADVPAHEDVSKPLADKISETLDEATDGEEKSKSEYRPVKQALSRVGLKHPLTKARTGLSERAMNEDSVAVESDMVDKTGLTSLSTEPSPNELVFARHVPDVGYVPLHGSVRDAPVQGPNGDAPVKKSECPW
ncbi:MAG: hypothetical protein Q9213_005852 [Squamulea squamosa]